VLQVSGLTLWRGSRCLFRDLAFRVEEGALLVLQGPNGSGKTSLLRVLAGLTRPDSGSVHFQGKDMAGLRQQRRLLAYLGHAAALKPSLTVLESLIYEARLAGLPKEQLPALARRLGIDGLEDLEIRQLSAGQKRRVAMARVLMGDAPIWLLDEPYTNIDAAGQQHINSMVREHLRRGGIALLATHQEVQMDGFPRANLILGVQQ
jgi:heme exporter protein A